MSDGSHVGSKADSLRTEPGVGRGAASFRLPGLLLRQARARVFAIGCLAALAFSLYLPITTALNPDHLPIAGFAARLGASLLLVFGGLSLALVAWSDRLPPARLLDAALGFEVAGALLISVIGLRIPWPEGDSVQGISWVCVWIVLFQIMILSTPGKTVIAATLSAVIGPAAMLVAGSAGYPLPSHGLVATSLVPNLVAAATAVAISVMLLRSYSKSALSRRMGAYELLRPLGKGGMGEVWLASHKELGHPAAIKIIRHNFTAAGSTRRFRNMRALFEREAAAMKALTSPHSVRILDFGISRDGRFYHVMEYLDGFDLWSLVEQYGAIPAERVVFILRQVCHSLADAHWIGLVHCDISPYNIYLCRCDGECDFVKVMDFGLVRHDIDHRTDLFDLGCVGYFLLTGEDVSEEDLPLQMARKRLKEDPSSITRSAELGRLILQCLEDDVEQRPESASALSERLAAIPLPSEWSFERARRWWDLHDPGDSAPHRHNRGNRLV